MPDLSVETKMRLVKDNENEPIGNRGLNDSLPRHVHPGPINPIFYGRFWCLVLRGVSSLDAFSSYPVPRSCSACPVGQLIDQRRGIIVPLVLNDPSSQTLAHFQ